MRSTPKTATEFAQQRFEKPEPKRTKRKGRVLPAALTAAALIGCACSGFDCGKLGEDFLYGRGSVSQRTATGVYRRAVRFYEQEGRDADRAAVYQRLWF